MDESKKELIDNISTLLEPNILTRALSRRIAACRNGTCTACGDLCLIKTDQWIGRHAPAVGRLFATQDTTPVFKITVAPERWIRARDDLASVNLDTIAKAIRRSFDTFRRPSIRAVGIIDAEYGWRQWEVATSLIVRGLSKSELLNNVLSGPRQVEEINDIGPAVIRLFQSANFVKRTPAFGHEEIRAGAAQEYYVWLASIVSGGRVLRYGCDRSFNPLMKSARPVKLKPKMPRPFPYWLKPHWFGHHVPGCLCIPCGGPGRRRT